jgi:acyl CoA:acetate/3-ketoacid CoA transferase
MFDYLLEPLGGLACSDVKFSRARTEIGAMRVIRRLLDEDYRVVIDVNAYGGSSADVHAVGLIPVDSDHAVLVSNFIPKVLGGGGITSIQNVASHVALNNDTHMPNHPLNSSNIYGIPNI